MEIDKDKDVMNDSYYYKNDKDKYSLNDNAMNYKENVIIPELFTSTIQGYYYVLNKLIQGLLVKQYDYGINQNNNDIVKNDELMSIKYRYLYCSSDIKTIIIGSPTNYVKNYNVANINTMQIMLTLDILNIKSIERGIISNNLVHNNNTNLGFTIDMNDNNSYYFECFFLDELNEWIVYFNWLMHNYTNINKLINLNKPINNGLSDIELLACLLNELQSNNKSTIYSINRPNINNITNNNNNMLADHRLIKYDQQLTGYYNDLQCLQDTFKLKINTLKQQLHTAKLHNQQLKNLHNTKR